jgi:hypothetical protein
MIPAGTGSRSLSAAVLVQACAWKPREERCWHSSARVKLPLTRARGGLEDTFTYTAATRAEESRKWTSFRESPSSRMWVEEGAYCVSALYRRCAPIREFDNSLLPVPLTSAPASVPTLTSSVNPSTQVTSRWTSLWAQDHMYPGILRRQDDIRVFGVKALMNKVVMFVDKST